MPTAGDIYYFASRGGSASRPPVVLIHGAGGDYLHWPHNIRRLPGYRVLAPDLPGHGRSEGLGQQSVRAYAQVVIDWLIETGIYRAVFVGHSMGGAIAQTLALEHQENVLGLGLVGTGARLRVNPALLERISSPETFKSAVDLVVEWSYARQTSPRQREQIRKQLASNRPSVLLGDYQACDRFDVMERVKDIRVPTCVICGEDDRMTPPKYSEYLAEHLPNAQLKLIPEAGHMVMLEQAEAVAGVLEDFLSTVSY